MPAWLTGFIDLLLPRRCPVCDSLLAPEDTGVCAGCQEGLDPLVPPFCALCGQPVSASDPSCQDPTGMCLACSQARLPLTWIRSAFAFGGKAQEIVWALKFGGASQLAPWMADRMADCLIAANWLPTGPTSSALESREPCLVAIPLHGRRLRHRGYDQAALLARCLAHRLGSPWSGGILERVLPTPPQARQPHRAARWASLRGAFRVRQSARLRGARLLLVDDVVTSGGTLAAAAAALLAAGAREVVGVSFARTLLYG